MQPAHNPRIDRGRGFVDLGDGRVEVNDLDVAAFILMRGVPISAARREGGNFAIVFSDSETRIPGLTVEYLNSEACRFANSLRSLKKVVLSGRGPPQVAHMRHSR